MYLAWKRTLLFLLVLVFGSFTGVIAQETITPTAAPSKTPTPVTGSEDERDTEAESSAITEPWTQSDLSILTGNVQRPNGLVWFNNKLYTSCNGDSTLYELDDTTGATRTYIFGVRNSHTMYAEQDVQSELLLWVPDFQTNRLLLVQRTGVSTISEDLAGPWGIEYLNEDEFLISNLHGNNLILMNRAGETRELLNGLRSPTGVVTDEENIYLANNGSSRRAIEWVNKSDVLESEAPLSESMPLVSGLQNTTNLVLAPDGHLYFAYALGTRGVVGRVDPQVCREQGGCSNNEVEIVLYTELAAPLAGLEIAPDMRLFVHTMFSPDIYWIQLDRPTDNSS